MDTKIINNYSKYSITSDGRVFNNKTGRQLKPGRTTKKRNYFFVVLSHLGKTKSFYVHRLVAENFIDNPENKSIVNHINGISTDNRVENLEWVSQKENVHHAYAAGLCPTSVKALQPAKINPAIVLEIRALLNNGTSQKTIASLYKIDQSTISNIKTRKIWKHIQ